MPVTRAAAFTPTTNHEFRTFLRQAHFKVDFEAIPTTRTMRVAVSDKIDTLVLLRGRQPYNRWLVTIDDERKCFRNRDVADEIVRPYVDWRNARIELERTVNISNFLNASIRSVWDIAQNSTPLPATPLWACCSINLTPNRRAKFGLATPLNDLPAAISSCRMFFYRGKASSIHGSDTLEDVMGGNFRLDLNSLSHFRSHKSFVRAFTNTVLKND